jgi:hypothetical protein
LRDTTRESRANPKTPRDRSSVPAGAGRSQSGARSARALARADISARRERARMRCLASRDRGVVAEAVARMVVDVLSIDVVAFSRQNQITVL